LDFKKKTTIIPIASGGLGVEPRDTDDDCRKKGQEKRETTSQSRVSKVQQRGFPKKNAEDY